MSECQSDYLTARDWGVGHDEMPWEKYERECSRGVGNTPTQPEPKISSAEWEKRFAECLAIVARKRSQTFRYCFDLDGTLCDTEGMDYEHARPRPAMIALVNALRDAGHFVLIVTGRGALSGNRAMYLRQAADQLERWGIHHQEVIGTGGPYDVRFDDRGVTVMTERR